MCLPDFIGFKQIDKDNPLIGYRNWKSPIKGLKLDSEHQNYNWKPVIEGPHEVTNRDSGIYAYNNYNNNNNYNYLSGIIQQFGKIAIHKIGLRSEYAKIDKLFTIRLSDAKGENNFLNWIPIFNKRIEDIAKIFEATTIHWQDFIENQK